MCIYGDPIAMISACHSLVSWCMLAQHDLSIYVYIYIYMYIIRCAYMLCMYIYIYIYDIHV